MFKQITFEKDTKSFQWGEEKAIQDNCTEISDSYMGK